MNAAMHFSANGICSSVLQHSFPERFDEAYKAEVADFVRGVAQTRATGTNGCLAGKDHVCSVTRIAEGARISSLEGGRWVTAEEFG